MLYTKINIGGENEEKAQIKSLNGSNFFEF